MIPPTLPAHGHRAPVGLGGQICIDLGTQLAMETSAKAPESYAGVFESLNHLDALRRFAKIVGERTD